MTILHKLQRKIRQIETAACGARGEVLSSGCPPLDRLLPQGGYFRGSLVEWLLPAPGSGAAMLSLCGARAACQHGGGLVIVDSGSQIFAPALAAWGINLAEVIMLRGDQTTAGSRDLYWAVNQALQCPGVAAVWGHFGQIDEQWFRRFQLAAESSGCMGFLLRPAGAGHQPSWSQIRWRVKPAAQKPTGLDHRYHRRLTVELLKCRGGSAGSQIDLAIETSTGKIRQVNHHEEKISMPLVSALAHPKAGRKASPA